MSRAKRIGRSTGRRTRCMFYARGTESNPAAEQRRGHDPLFMELALFVEDPPRSRSSHSCQLVRAHPRRQPPAVTSSHRTRNRPAGAPVRRQDVRGLARTRLRHGAAPRAGRSQTARSRASRAARSRRMPDGQPAMGGDLMTIATLRRLRARLSSGRWPGREQRSEVQRVRGVLTQERVESCSARLRVPGARRFAE